MPGRKKVCREIRCNGRHNVQVRLMGTVILHYRKIRLKTLPAHIWANPGSRSARVCTYTFKACIMRATAHPLERRRFLSTCHSAFTPQHFRYLAKNHCSVGSKVTSHLLQLTKVSRAGRRFARVKVGWIFRRKISSRDASVPRRNSERVEEQARPRQAKTCLLLKT